MRKPQTKRSNFFDHYAELTFHYGLSFDEIAGMPNVAKKAYVDALPRLLAQRQSDLINAVTYPHLKKEEQSRFSRRLDRLLRPPEAPADKQALQSKASTAGIGVKVKPPSAEAARRARRRRRQQRRREAESD